MCPACLPCGLRTTQRGRAFRPQDTDHQLNAPDGPGRQSAPRAGAEAHRGRTACSAGGPLGLDRLAWGEGETVKGAGLALGLTARGGPWEGWAPRHSPLATVATETLQGRLRLWEGPSPETGARGPGAPGTAAPGESTTCPAGGDTGLPSGTGGLSRRRTRGRRRAAGARGPAEVSLPSALNAEGPYLPGDRSNPEAPWRASVVSPRLPTCGLLRPECPAAPAPQWEAAAHGLHR